MLDRKEFLWNKYQVWEPVSKDAFWRGMLVGQSIATLLLGVIIILAFKLLM